MTWNIYELLNKNKKIYGAVAYLDYEIEADTEASKHGLFVIEASGNSAKIVNVDNFKPKNFCNS